MKKLLALVLALVMTLGLATVGTNAAATKFGDDSTIKYTEAAAVMSAIGVFDGDDSNNFRPTETLKRSEAAKIVAYLMLTKKTADGLVASGSRYNDVPANHWAAGYIEYLTSAGVLGGVGDGKFNPDGDIATVDFAKMLLVALGFDAKIENLVLSDYRINTVKLANEVKLFEGNNDVTATNAITRQEACLYAFNMVKTPIVEYDNTTTVNVPNSGVNVTIGSGKAHKKTTSDGTESRQTISYKGDLSVTNAQGVVASNWYIEFGEQYYPDLELVGRDKDGKLEYTFDDMGRPARKWSFKKVDLGTYALNDSYLLKSYTAKVSRENLYDLLGKSTYDNLVAGRSALDVWYDGYYQVGDVDTFIARNDAKASNGTDDGAYTEVYRDKDGNVIIVSYDEYVYQVVSDYSDSSKSIRVSKAGDTAMNLENYTIKLEDYPQIADYKADDYVLITVDKSADNYGKVTDIKKATVLTGEVNSFTTKTDGSTMKDVTINGEKKSYSHLVSDTGVKLDGFSIGKNASVVLNSAGYIVAVDEAVVVTDYVLVRKWGGNGGLNSKAHADAIFSDGTSAEITVKEAWDYENGKRVTKSGDIQDWAAATGDGGDNTYRWYAYSKNSSGEYTLSQINKNYSYSFAAYNLDDSAPYSTVLVTNSDSVQFISDSVTEGKPTYSNGASADDATDKLIKYTDAKANDKTVMVVRDVNEDLYVYTGVKNLAKVTLNEYDAKKNPHSSKTLLGSYWGTSADKNFDAGVFTLNNKDGYVVAAYVEVNVNAAISGSANDNLIYVRDYEKDVHEKDKTWYNYRIFTIDGEETTAVGDNRIAASGYTVANYASRNKDGNLTNFQEVELGKHNGNIVSGSGNGRIYWSNGVLSFDGIVEDGGKTSFTVDKDTKVLLVMLKSVDHLFSRHNRDFQLEPMVGTAKGVADFTRETKVDYKFVARTTTDNGTVLKELYVTFGEDSTAAESSVSTQSISDWLSNNKAAGRTAKYDAEKADIVIDNDVTIEKSSGGKNSTLKIGTGTTAGNANNVTINGDVTIDTGCTLEIYANGTVTINGHVTNEAALIIKAKTVNINNHSLELVEGSKTTIDANMTNIYGDLFYTADDDKTNDGKSETKLTFGGENTGNVNVSVGTSYNVDLEGVKETTVGGNMALNSGTASIGKTNVKGDLTTASGSTLNVKAAVEVDGDANLQGSLTVSSTADVKVVGSVDGTDSNKNKVAKVEVALTVKDNDLAKIATTADAYATVDKTVYKISNDTVTITVTLKPDNSVKELPTSASDYTVTGSTYNWTVKKVTPTETGVSVDADGTTKPTSSTAVAEE